MFEHPVSHAEVTFRPGKSKYATTVCRVIWAELSDDMLIMSSVEKKTQTVYQGSVMGEREGGSGSMGGRFVEHYL